ncbi:ABC transporter permease [Gordonia terrae]|uniref:Iron ABC transporter permease n=2 Tax=Gordonia terrae TaxID=2055 RepID=A0AAD0P025_9ACTN|nr:iron ABC transporter permease [Gordonia terrae]VTR07680.1 binding-protein-dependent transport system inner membrane protein [Clostridioides difficile]ANY23875.1 ABC transporter permease [Gordonia terrae]AWO84609.1 iron ABC transporter permease [Gordonia terrae]VTS55481.1 Molybdenum transport system permease protein modB [Gordonia terrae]GAB42095.1 putative ABC transporter permease protein [Gordonia terrae NBRC 100016]
MATTLQPAPPDRPAAAKRRPFRDVTGPATVSRWVWAALMIALVGYPVVRIIWESLRTDGGLGLSNYSILFEDSLIGEAIFNSLWVAIGSSVGSLLIALPMAWLLVRTDVPGRRIFRSVAVLTFAAPSFIAALGWVLLLGPRNGVLNNAIAGLFGLESNPFDIFGPWGIIFVLSLFLYPLILMPVSAALEGIDPALEHAASSLGGGRARVLRTITFPIVMPSVVAGTILVFVTSVVVFGPVAVLGSPAGFDTIPTVLLQLLKFPPRIELAAVIAVPIVVMIAGLLLIQRRIVGSKKFVVIGGKPGRQAPMRLGLWKLPAFAFAMLVATLSLILPFGMLLVMSFRKAVGIPIGGDNWTWTGNYEKIFSSPGIVSAFFNSIFLALTATVAAMVVAVLAAWLRHRTTNKSNGIIPGVMASPLAFPGAIFAIGIIIAYAGVPFGLAGTLMILGIAYTAHALPMTFSYVDAGMGQIGAEMEEASRSLGAGWFKTVGRVTIPLLKPSLLAAGLLNFVILLRELEMSIFLYTGSNPTIATTLYGLANDSLYQQVGALSVVVLAINLVVALLALRMMRQRD